MSRWALWALLLVSACASAEPRDLRFYGYAYDQKSNRYLYTEVHQLRIDGARWLSSDVRYIDADGMPLGHKKLDFRQDPYLPLYELDMVGSDYREGLEQIDADKAVLIKVEHGKSERNEIRRRPAMVADAGFLPYVADHFDELLAGKTVRFSLVVASEQTTFRFRAKRLRDEIFEGRPAVRIKIELDSLLRLLAPPLQLVFDRDERRLLEYFGLSNIHNPRTGDDYNVRIAYYDRPPADAPPHLPPLD